MLAEAGEASSVVAEQLRFNGDAMAELAEIAASMAPPVILTCARGSSDHAALFGKYLFETRLGAPVASFAPSVASLYGASMRLSGALFLAISQSGGSPDLVVSAERAKLGGAYVVAFVNTEESPLADAADFVVPLHAGPERSVAATKSYIASLSALAHFSSAYALHASGEKAGPYAAALEALPEQLALAWDQDWSVALDPLRDAANLFVVGRGHGLAIAEEAALKFKETSALHAEAYSAAEVKHGPMAIVSDGVPVLAFEPTGPARAGFDDLITDFGARGARCFVAGGEERLGAIRLPSVESADPALTPILQIQSFYKFVNAFSLARGQDPDRPPFLRKVTETR
ncbi:MAG: SIS domain-containing protein [Pseudomonadota bacterium]